MKHSFFILSILVLSCTKEGTFVLSTAEVTVDIEGISYHLDNPVVNRYGTRTDYIFQAANLTMEIITKDKRLYQYPIGTYYGNSYILYPQQGYMEVCGSNEKVRISNFEFTD